MKKFGIAAYLSFVDKGATAAMGRVGRAATVLQSRFRGIGTGVSQVGTGMTGLAMTLAPAAAGLGLMAKKGADFQQSVANLRAVTLDVTNSTTPALRSLAKTLGATTVFSATQSANAMTELARAGLDTQQIMGAVRGTLDAAAAEGIDLASAARMVSSNMKAFNMDASEASKIAGMLALASARTNTNMTLLQESLKLAAPAVKDLKIPMADTVALVGAMADIGLRGTLGATGLRAAVGKLLNPTKDARKAMSAMGVSFAKVQEMLDRKDLAGVFKMVMTQLRGIPSNSKRAALAVRLFGIRGRSMVAAMDLSDTAMKRFNVTLEKLRKETGQTATDMKNIQLNTLRGQVTLLSSAFEGLSIEIFDAFSTEIRSGVESLGSGIQNVALALRVMSGEKIIDPDAAKRVKEMSPVFFEIARGIREGLGEVKSAIRSVGESVGWLGEKFGLTGDGSAQSTARIITKVTLLAAAFAPVALAIGGVTRLFVSLGQVAAGTAKIVGNTLALAAKGAGGLLGVVGKRVPKLGAFLGKFGGLLGKAGRLTEQVTAQPVRVVNFGEMGMGTAAAKVLPGTSSGARELELAGSKVKGVLSRFGTAVNGVTSKLGQFGLLGAAAGLGVAIGTLIDRMTGASDKISDAAMEVRNSISKPAQDAANSMTRTLIAAESIEKAVALSRRGIKTVGVAGTDKRVGLDRAAVQARIVEGFRRNNLTQKQIALQLTRLQPFLARLPAAPTGVKVSKPKVARDAMIERGGLIPVSAGDVVLDRASLARAVVSQMRGGLVPRAVSEATAGGSGAPRGSGGGETVVAVPVSIDGREVARAVARVKLDELERSGAQMRPGDRTNLLERGFEGVK